MIAARARAKADQNQPPRWQRVLFVFIWFFVIVPLAIVIIAAVVENQIQHHQPLVCADASCYQDGVY